MINVSHLTKKYGSFTAVSDLSFEIESGHVYGFLGPNGAGKSTTMNIITGCLSPTEGSVEIGGFDIVNEPVKAKKLIGYLPEIPPLYMNETPEEYLEFVGSAKGLKGENLANQIEYAIEKTGLEEMRTRLISALSKGYRQRVGIAQALLGNPEVIILDEPTVGLDPIQIVEIRDLIKSLGEDHTVIFSSHILSEVKAICEKVLIISKGRLVAFDTPDNIERLMTPSSVIAMTVKAAQSQTEEILKGAENIADYEIKDNGDGTVTARIETDADDIRAVSAALVSRFTAGGIPVYETTAEKATFEDAFIGLTGADEETENNEENEEAEE